MVEELEEELAHDISLGDDMHLGTLDDMDITIPETGGNLMGVTDVLDVHTPDTPPHTLTALDDMVIPLTEITPHIPPARVQLARTYLVFAFATYLGLGAGATAYLNRCYSSISSFY